MMWVPTVATHSTKGSSLEHTDREPFMYHAMRTDRYSASSGSSARLDVGSVEIWQMYTNGPDEIDMITGVLSEIDTALKKHKAKIHVMKPMFGPIARAEFFRRPDGGPTGLVLFDSYGQFVMYVQYALLGYSGNGFGFSQSIMAALGVPNRMLQQINHDCRDKSYRVVFSREQTRTVKDEVYAVPSGDICPEWECWHYP